jgi:hypothetical protein
MADAYTVAVDGMRVTAASCGASWGISCWEGNCRANVIGYRGAADSIKGAAAHLIWHVNGMPTCEDCGAWLAYKSSRRCRKGTCEAGG